MSFSSFSQDLMFTVLPTGQTSEGGHTYLDFSVIVSPRLKSTSNATTTLAQYPDWADPGRTWPSTVTALLAGAGLTLNLPGAPNLSLTVPATLVGAVQPDKDRYASVLPPTTPVNPYAYQSLSNTRIRSAPVGSMVDTLADLYGKFGTLSPSAYPSYASLVKADAFGALGFEQESVRDSRDPGIVGNGAVRKSQLLGVLDNAYKKNTALPYDLTALAATVPSVPGAEVSLIGLLHQQFHQRGLTPRTSFTARPSTPVFDFHQAVAAMSSLPTLMRVAGLVLDFRTGPVDTLVPKWAAHTYLGGTASFSVDSSVFAAGTTVVAPLVQSQFGTGIFKAAPRPGGNDMTARMLKIGDTSLYRTVRVEHDGAITKAMQFANTVTRAHRNGKPLTYSTPATFALPALHTGGFAVARSGRAVELAGTLQRATDVLQAGYFGGNGSPVLYEDDITRGFRFDVLLVKNDDVWRSLMWRQGQIAVDGSDPLDVLEEDCVVPSPTTASTQETDPGDLYLQETLTRWDGWSLAVPRPGQPFQDDEPSSSARGSNGFNVTTSWRVPGADTDGTQTKATNARRLPRLRFGESYQLRARAVDLAGNSLAVEDAVVSALTVTRPLRHLRFEPLPAPRALLTGPPLPGGSEETIVVRSESATVDGTAKLDNAVTLRLLVPAPTSVTLAEQHRAFDEATAGKPMDAALALYTDVAKRDAHSLQDDGQLLDPSSPAGTANPYRFPAFLPVRYLPEYASPGALVRHLPRNTTHHTVAALPFDAAHKGWPQLQAVRVLLQRGAAPNWAVKTVTSGPNTTAELVVALGKGDMVTTQVNSMITQSIAENMAMWEWIQQWAAANGENASAVWTQILAGNHWMFTPWRDVTFVHAVRTPLKNPRLYLSPHKSTIGQTDAVFDGRGRYTFGTVLMSRKSTARIDVDGSWRMPIDTGDNDDPVTPVPFTGHAFSLELDRDGVGIDPSAHTSSAVKVPDAENFLATHEFNDTKFRAVTYRGTATSYYVEYFRESLTLPLSGNPVTALQAAPVEPGVAFEASTVKLVLHWTDDTGAAQTRALVSAPLGTAVDTPAPTPGDYVVIQDPTLASNPSGAVHGTVQMLANGTASVPDDATCEFSYVGPTIHTYSNPVSDRTTSTQMLVPNSKRPSAPSVRYVLPIYRYSTRRGVTSRTGGALRVYLERPWWSSGDGERLGVVCWHRTGPAVVPPNALSPYVTLWGFDPVFASTTALPTPQPTPDCFPLATARSSDGVLTVDETSGAVDVAGHNVGFDAVRNLWYCDIRVTAPGGAELKSYTPFIRFAFARYQPNSINNAHLSKVVVVDYAQLAPNRSLTMTGTGSSRSLTIVGRGPVATASSSLRSVMRVMVETRDPRIADDTLAWSPSGTAISLSASVRDGDLVTWHGTVRVAVRTTRHQRITVEEYERLPGGTGHGRLVFTHSLPVS